MKETQLLAKWIAGCRRADEGSQLELYRHFFGYSMSISLRYAKTREAAREIVNDGFLKVFLTIDQYDPAQPYKPWLRQILIHSAIDYYRKYDAHQGEPYRVPAADL